MAMILSVLNQFCAVLSDAKVNLHVSPRRRSAWPIPLLRLMEWVDPDTQQPAAPLRACPDTHSHCRLPHQTHMQPWAHLRKGRFTYVRMYACMHACMCVSLALSPSRSLSLTHAGARSLYDRHAGARAACDSGTGSPYACVSATMGVACRELTIHNRVLGQEHPFHRPCVVSKIVY